MVEETFVGVTNLVSCYSYEIVKTILGCGGGGKFFIGCRLMYF